MLYFIVDQFHLVLDSILLVHLDQIHLDHHVLVEAEDKDREEEEEEAEDLVHLGGCLSSCFIKY